MNKNTIYKKLFFCIGMFFTTLQAFSAGQDTYFKILPQPQLIEINGKKGIRTADVTFILAKEEAQIPVLGNIINTLPRYKKQGVGINLILTDEKVPEEKEGYTLEINSKGVIISSKSQAGLFYGCQTLEQLFEDSRDFNKEIPAMKITDFPKISYRAVYFDNKHHLDRMEYYYRAIDKLAHYKINAVIWEIEDKLRYTRRPEIGAGNAISKQEMQALSRYAKERNIEISPLIQGLGHAGFILKHHWELRENPYSDWEFCPSDPRTYELQFDLYRDAIEAMPYGKYLHVGGDEITAIGIDERCKATGKSAFELQMTWLQKVCKFATDHGRTPIFWDDMPLKYAGLWDLIISKKTDKELEKVWNTEKLDKAIDLFPKNCVYMRWNYGDATLPAHQRILTWYHNKGLKVMGATAASSGDSPFLPRENTKAGYIKGFSTLVADNQLEGILSTSWDDGSPHPETVWRGYIAQGEYGWNPHARNVEEFKSAHGQREFGFVPKDSIMNFLNNLEQAAFFFDGALVTQGRRNPAWGTQGFTLLDLPDKNKPGEWNIKYKEKVSQAEKAVAGYKKISTQIQHAKAHALRNRYTLDIYEQTNNLIVYPSQLIIALSNYDKATDKSKQENALKELYETCEQFDTMKQNLEKVYSETRFMQNPDGYIEDMNHHNHLAAKTNNSDWIYLYELPMVNKVKRWLTGAAADINYRIF